MKKAIAIIVFFLGFSVTALSQESTKESCLTSGKWRIETVKIGEEVEDFSDCTNSWLVFQENGSYQLVIRKTEKKGQWKLENGKEVLKFENQGAIDDFKILKLTDKELLFSATEGDLVYTMTLKK